MRLLALSDLHVGYKTNMAALEALPDHPDDWLIVAGDVGETLEHMQRTFGLLTQRFARVFWVPGNHELYTLRRDTLQAVGVARYHALVNACRELGVLTPEDPWVLWPGEGPTTRIALLFVPYDYSFAPDGFSPDEAKAWAREQGIICSDESLIDPAPHPDMQSWCAERVRISEARLRDVPKGERLILVNHFPLRRDLVRLFRIPRFTPWCGTRATEDWHRRFPVDAVVSGHLHMRATDWRHGVRFEEVSLGYPRHWRQDQTAEGYLRTILPSEHAERWWGGPLWHR